MKKNSQRKQKYLTKFDYLPMDPKIYYNILSPNHSNNHDNCIHFNYFKQNITKRLPEQPN